MTQTWIQRSFAPLKRVLPRPMADLVRGTITAVIAPFFQYYRCGHFRSSLARRAVDRYGKALPWYTYPCIEFLKRQCFAGRHVLEFGGGQSTYWWASVQAIVTTLEADDAWFNEMQSTLPSNVIIHLVSGDDAKHVEPVLASCGRSHFDIIVIDGLRREEMIDLAIPLLAQNGAVICDNSSGYGFFEGFRGKGFQRVDFYGPAPGVILPSCTSIFFRDRCFLFDNSHPISETRD
jgi:hypothetical protein